MATQPVCPNCNSEYTYEDRDLTICSMCAHEWKKGDNAPSNSSERVVKDAHGNILKDGDTVTVIKDLKVKGSSSVVKVGTKVKNIKLVDADHDIDCRIEGVGQMGLKSQFVRKL